MKMKSVLPYIKLCLDFWFILSIPHKTLSRHMSAGVCKRVWNALVLESQVVVSGPVRVICKCAAPKTPKKLISISRVWKFCISSTAFLNLLKWSCSIIYSLKYWLIGRWWIKGFLMSPACKHWPLFTYSTLYALLVFFVLLYFSFLSANDLGLSFPCKMVLKQQDNIIPMELNAEYSYFFIIIINFVSWS